uniref:DUF4190 domain-containing protein n=1 Tax=Knufia peltigerae TaxID=1002370 RepID=A0AA39CR35_9EURO|nr:hypothetical protein H2204_013764 [Knufia peltigerae]
MHLGQSPSGDPTHAVPTNQGRIPTGAPTLDFSGRRVLIAGGSKGIGRELALAFAGAGAQVSVCARGQTGLDALQADARAQGTQLHTFAADLGDLGRIGVWLQAAADTLGGIDVLVNNATGYGMADDEDGWAASLQIDLMAAVRASRLALPWLRASSDACILNLSSIAAQQPRPGGAPYAAAKAALSHYTTSQALALAPDRIRVNAIAPGSIEFADGLWDRRRVEDPALYHGTLAKIPFGRFGQPREIADAALFLCSPLARWITGHVLNVDGGQRHYHVGTATEDSMSVPPRQTNALAVVSLIAGICSWTVLPGVAALVAIITGHLARAEIRRRAGEQDGDGMALAGLIMGWLNILAAVGLVAILIFAMVAAGADAKPGLRW